MYHSIDRSGSPISLSPAVFQRHVSYLATASIRLLDVPSLLAAPPDVDALALTFDDALATFATEAWPRLAEYDIPVTLFVATGRVGGTNAWGGQEQPGIPTLPLLDWDALARLAEAGVTLGAHSRSHADLRRVSDAQLEDEVNGAVGDIAAHTGRVVHGYAYPYGAHDARVVAVVARTVAWACTTRFRVLRSADPPHLLPRLDAYYFRGSDRLEAWGTWQFRTRLRLVAARRRLGALSRL